MKTATKGNGAEAAILHALIERGHHVLVPFGGGHPYDLVVDLGTPGFLRVQCKTAWPSGGCAIFKTRSTDHGRGPQSYIGVADLFGVYFPPTKSVYLVPLDAVPDGETSRLRIAPTLNNQQRRIRFADDFEIDRWTFDALCELVP